jgi:hypothetical protein
MRVELGFLIIRGEGDPLALPALFMPMLPIRSGDGESSGLMPMVQNRSGDGDASGFVAALGFALLNCNGDGFMAAVTSGPILIFSTLSGDGDTGGRGAERAGTSGTSFGPSTVVTVTADRVGSAGNGPFGGGVACPGGSRISVLALDRVSTDDTTERVSDSPGS